MKGQRLNRIKNTSPQLSKPDIGTVTTHDKNIFLKVFQLTSLWACSQPVPTTDPTLQCVELIGRPSLLAKSTVDAAPISIANPLNKTTLMNGVQRKNLLPIFHLKSNKHFCVFPAIHPLRARTSLELRSSETRKRLTLSVVFSSDLRQSYK
jgi:hypothetical protein